MSLDEMAEVLTELAIPTGGRRKDGTLNTHWTSHGIAAVLRNEKHCGDVLARKYYTPNYKDHKQKKNKGNGKIVGKHASSVSKTSHSKMRQGESEQRDISNDGQNQQFGRFTMKEKEAHEREKSFTDQSV